MDIRKRTCLIIKRNGEYLVGMNQVLNCLNWSTSPYDAWRTRNAGDAARVARATGGTMYLFNPVAAQIREFTV